VTQKTEAIKTRRLKKADFEVDFVFINEVESFPSAVDPQTVVGSLGEMMEQCQHLFLGFLPAMTLTTAMTTDGVAPFSTPERLRGACSTN
jgi:hypothetical protein